LPKSIALEKNMKFACNNFRFLFFAAVIVVMTSVSCVKDPLTTDVKIAENIGKITTVQMQMYSLLDQLRNGFDGDILPFGVKKQLVDSNEIDHSKTYRIDFGKGLLCGDYITRKGILTYKHVVDPAMFIDSVICDMQGLIDSFGCLTANGAIQILGKYCIVKTSPTSDIVISNLKIWKDPSLLIVSNQSVGVKRILAEPTKISSKDGFQFDGGLDLVLIRESYSIIHTFDVTVSKCEKLVNAANFPEVGKLICNKWGNSNNSEIKVVTIDFDPMSDAKQDKVAKATSDNSEWFFEIQ
jgi:hypothetical protein